MDETEINTETIGAKGLLDDSSFISEKKSSIPKSPENETSFQKDTVTLPEELSMDKSEKALSGSQTSVFINTGAPVASSESFLLSAGTINGPVSHSTLAKTSIMKKGNISLTTAQTVDHQADSCSSATVVHDLQLSTKTSTQNSNQQQALFLLPEAAHAKNQTHSVKNLPPSASISCDMQPSIGKSIKSDSTLVTQVDVCEDSKSSLEKDGGKSLTGISSGTGDFRTDNDAKWDPQKDFIEFFMTNEETVDKSPVEPKVGVQKRRKRKMDVSKITRYTEDCFNESNYIPDNSDSFDIEFSDQSENLQVIESQNYSLVRVKPESTDEELEVVDAIQQLIYNPSNTCADDTSPVHSSTFLSNTLLNKHEQDDLETPSNFSTDEPSFYPCTKCNVNFREKKHLHRHMMYHLDGNSHFRHLNVPRPYACRECGRTFRDRNSLLKHMIIHQERRQKLMEEIRELKELQDEGRSARLQCPQCVFGTNCPKTFVQHAKTHEKDKRYYCCEECNFMAVTESELECHRGIAHGAVVKCSLITTDISQRKAQKKTLVKDSYMESAKKSADYMCKLCPFVTSARSILKKHMEYLHPASCIDSFGSRLRLEKRKSHFIDESLHFGSRTKHLIKQASAFPKTSFLKQDMKRPFGSAFQSSNFAKLHRRPPRIQKARKSVAQSAKLAGEKDSYETEDESSWDNVELCDYTTPSVEDDSYTDINQDHVNLFPLFKDNMEEEIGGKSSLRYEQNDGFYFEYYEDGEGSNYLHDFQDPHNLENIGTTLPKHNSVFHWSDLSLEKKNCPYCPATFETGVGLSNHVRGHLHRAGLSYEARHVVSPEQIATSDKMQHFKRTVTGTPVKRVRKAIEKSENSSEHTCQLCGGWFDTKIGLSNHVRGHLKRLGKTKWDAHKSPICVLNEMMQNEEKYEKILKALNSRRVIPRPFVAQKLSSNDDFLSQNVIPLEAYRNGLKTEDISVSASEEEGLSFFNECDEAKSVLRDEKKNQSLTLIELLKNKKVGEERNPDISPQKIHNQTARKRFVQKCVLPLDEDSPLMYQPQKMDLTLQSAVDCKQKKSRSRSGSKKKMLPLPHGADEVYILRCRFCGLVFRGPLSVQEDWIKHLQRHIVNANLPRTGAGMVEVTSLLKKPASISETSFSFLMAEAAS